MRRQTLHEVQDAQWNGTETGDRLPGALAVAPAAATAAATPGDRGQDFVQTQAIAARCQKTLPGLELQLQEGRKHWLSTLDAAQLQAAEAYASSQEGKALEKGVEQDASRAFGRTPLSAAATCVGLLAEYGPAHPLPAATAMPADRVQHYSCTLRRWRWPGCSAPAWRTST